MQVTEHVHAIKIPFQVKSPAGVTIERFVYVYLIYGEKVYLIDTGVASSELVIFDYLRKTGRNPGDISTVVLTHSHPDHIGAAKTIQKESGCKIAAHRAERSWIEDVELQVRERPVPGFHSLVEGSVAVDHILTEGDMLNLEEGLSLEVFHTPGHSKGSISLLLHGDGALFCGDVVPIAGDMPIYEDVLASVTSVKKLRDIQSKNVLLASWDDPRQGEQIYIQMDEGVRYLQRIHDAVLKVAGGNLSMEPSKLCGGVLGELGLPAIAANPLIARSFEAHLKIYEHRDLLRD